MEREQAIGQICANCGFVALRNRQTRGLDEAEQRFRDMGKSPNVPRMRPYDPYAARSLWASMGDQLYEEYPICFAQKILFEAEIQTTAQRKDSANTPDDIRDYLRQHTCDEWTRWRQGFTPKEHSEMLDRKWRFEWQAKREDADRAWREQQEAKADKRHKWTLIIMGGVVTAVYVIAQMVAALISRGGAYP